MLVGFDFGVGEEGDDPVLKGAEPTFDLAFGLGRGRAELGDSRETTKESAKATAGTNRMNANSNFRLIAFEYLKTLHRERQV